MLLREDVVVRVLAITVQNDRNTLYGDLADFLW